MPEGPTRITLILSGAISLGAYEAGAVAQLAYALDNWPTNSARPVIDIISGASAGSITGAMLASHLARRTPVKDFVLGSLNCWCSDTVTFASLLNVPNDNGHKNGFLTADGIDKLSNHYIPDDAGTQSRPGDGFDLAFTCTLTSLEPIPFDIVIDDPSRKSTNVAEIKGATYQDCITFHIDQSGSICEVFGDVADHHLDQVPSTWARLRTAAVASAAIPIAWQPIRIAHRSNDRLGFEARSYVDGGVLNNMPLNRASDALVAVKPETGGKRLHVLIVPDPVLPNPDEPLGQCENGRRDGRWNVKNILGRTYDAVREQTFYRDLRKGEEVNHRIDLRDNFLFELVRLATIGTPLPSDPDLRSREIKAKERAVFDLARKALMSGKNLTNGSLRDIESHLKRYRIEVEKLQAAQASLTLIREHHNDLEELFIRNLFAAEVMADLNDKCLMQVETISPGPRTQLAGRRMGHFGGLIDRRLMLHDFNCGISDAVTWLTRMYETHPGWSIPASVFDAKWAPAAGIKPPNANASPWSLVTKGQRRAVRDRLVYRAIDYACDQIGIGRPIWPFRWGFAKLAEWFVKVPEFE